MRGHGHRVDGVTLSSVPARARSVGKVLGGVLGGVLVLAGLVIALNRPSHPDEPAATSTPASTPTATSVGTPAGTPTAGSSRPAPASPSTAVKLPPLHAGFDYQLGGPYPPPAGVEIVTRDRTAPPVEGLYNICYVNAF